MPRVEEDQVESPTTVEALWKSYCDSCLKNADEDTLAAFKGCFYSAVLGIYGLLDFIAKADESGQNELANDMMQSLESEIESYMVDLDAAFEARDH